MSSPRAVFVVLATCDGEAFLAQQLQSLQRQTFTDWRLLAHDDLSTDGTPDLLLRIAGEDERVVVLPSRHAERLGPARNFDLLLRSARDEGAEVVLPCDQDDVWKPTKVEELVRSFDEVDLGRPALVYSDLEVADRKLAVTHPSLLALLGYRDAPEGDALRPILVQNFVTGCACAVNRALLDLALPIPAEVVNFDWWLGLCAVAGGRLRCVPRPLVTYRQHGSNAVGALTYRDVAASPVRLPVRAAAKHRSLLRGQLSAVAELSRRLEARRPEASEALAGLEEFQAIVGSGEGRLRRLMRLRRRGFWPRSWKRRLLLLQALDVV
ncbi:MAG: glycosyltransferase family 2 protein [Thermoanaerobaculia bacterium]|nr:glycosyltransferase family 2 protein [Thermoanaerobaculia bacterium]